MSTEPNRELPKVPGQPEAVPGSESKDTDRVSVMERKLEAMESLLKKNDVLTQAEKELRGQLTILKQKVAKLDRDAVSVSGASRAIEKIETQIDGLHQRIATVRGEVLAVQANVSSVDTTEKVHTPAVEVSKHKKREKEVINQIAPLLDSRSVEPKHKERLLGAIILGDFDGVDSQGIKRELDELKTLSDLSPELKVDAELARGLMQIISTDKIFGKDKPAKLKEYLAKHQDKISKENNPLFFAAKTNADKIIRTYEPEPIKPPASEPVPVVLNPEPTTAVTEPVVEPIAEPPTISESKNTGDNLTGKKEIAFRLFSSVLPPNEFLGVTHYLKPNSDARDTSITRFVIRKRGKNELVDKYLTARQVVQWIRKEHGNRMSNVNEDELLDLFEDWIELKDGVGNGLPEITPDLSKKEAGTVPDRATNKEITSEEFVAALCDRFFRNLRIFPTTNGHYEVVVGPNQRVDLFAVEWKRILPDQDFNRFAEEMGLDPRAISLSKQEISNYILDQVKARDAKVHPEKNDTENIGHEGFSEKECQKIIKTVFSGVTLSRREGAVFVTDSEGNTRPYKKFVKEEIFDDPTSFDRLALVYRKITGQSKFDERDVMNRILGFLEATLPADSNLPEPARVTAPVSVPAAPRSDAKERRPATATKVETPEQQAEQLRVRELFADNTHLKVNTISPNHITSTKEGPYNNGKSEAAAELEKSDVLIVGDVHASAWKVMQTLITGGRATMPEDKAKKFAELYSVAIDETKNNGDKITEKFSQTIAEMNECIKTMEWKDSAKPVVFIGDMIADRGLSDSLVLTIINHLKEKAGDNLRITASNHDLGPLLFSISKDQSASFARFPERFNDDQKSREMLRAYYQNLDLFLFNSETKTFISHAPIDQTLINTLAARLGFDFLITEKSVSDFVNEANKWFKKLLSGFIDAARKGNDDLNNFRQSFKADLDLFNSGADSDQGLVWSRRDYAATEELPFGNLPIKYVHGHDSDSRTSSPFSVLNNPQPDSNKPQVINLDNDYRKGMPIDKPGRVYKDNEFNRICVLSDLSGAPFNDTVPKPTTPETESAPAPEVVETKPVTFELFDGTKIDTALAGHHIVIHKDVVRLQNKKDSKKTRSVENFSITYQPKWTAESDFSSEIVVSGVERKVKLRLPISSPQEIEFEYKKTSEIQGLVDKFKNLVAEFDTKNQAVEAVPETAAASSTPPEVVPESTIYHNAAVEGSAIMAPVSLDAGAESLVTSTHTVSRVVEAPPAPPTPPVSSEHHEAHSSDRLIIDIPEHEIANLFPKGALQEIIVGLTDPSTRAKAVLDFKYFFTQCNNKTELAEKVKKFGYKSLGEFLQHWTDDLHKKPLAAFELWVNQIEQKAIDESISFTDNVGAGVTWEKFKKFGRMAARIAPVAVAAFAGTAATITLTGGAALAGAGVAGAISGFFGRFFRKSETFKKTDKEAAVRIAEKEATIRKEKTTDTEVRGKVTKGVAAIDENQFNAFLSQALRDSSADGLHVGEPANAALIRVHGLRVIDRAMAVRRRNNEEGLEGEQEHLERKLDLAIATLYSNGQEDQARVRALIEKNPLMQKALAKVLEIKGGGSIEEKNSQLHEVMGYVGAMAAGAGLSIATTMDSLWRMVPGGLAGGYIGIMYGHEKDREAQANAFVKDAEETLDFAENELLPAYEKEPDYLSGRNAENLDQTDSKLRTLLHLKLLDNRIELKVRANNILRRIDAWRLEQEGDHVEQLKNLITQLNSSTKALQERKKGMIDSLDKHSKLRTTIYGIAGAIAGGVMGFKGAEWMKGAYAHFFPSDQELLNMDLSKLEQHQLIHSQTAEMEMPQSHRAPEIPEFNEPKFSVADFAKDHNLDAATKEYLVRLTTKFPDLNNPDSLERLLAAGQRGSLPEFGTRESGVFLQEAAEADIVKFEEILKHGGPTQAAAYLEARGFNSLDHRFLGTKDYTKFAQAYQTKVLANDNPDTHLRGQLAKAFQHDEMRDSHDWASNKTGKTMYGDGARTSLGRDAIILGTDETVPRGGVIADKAKEFLYNKSLKPESLKLDLDQMRRLNDARAYDLVEKVKEGEVDLKTLKSELPVENESAGHPTISSLEMSADPGYVDVLLANGQTMKAAVHINAAGEPVLVSTNKYQLENRAQLPVQKFGTSANIETQRVASGGAERVPEDPTVVASRLALENKSAKLFEQQVSRLTTEAAVLQNTLGIKAALTDELGNAKAVDKAFQDFAREFIKGRPDANMTDPRFQAEFSQAWNAHGTELIAKHAIEMDNQADEDDMGPVLPPEPTGAKPLPERVRPLRAPEPLPAKPKQGVSPPEPSKLGKEVIPTASDTLGASKDQNLVLLGLNNKDQVKLSVWDKSEAKAVGLTLKSDYAPKVGEDGRLEIKLGEYSAKGEIQKINIEGKPKWAFVVKDDAMTEWFPLDRLNKGDMIPIVPKQTK